MTDIQNVSKCWAVEPWSPFHVQNIIRDIEATYRGWIWSLSWRCNELTITLIPAHNSVLEIDRLIADTERGDKGFIFSFRIESPDDAYLGQTFIKSINNVIVHVRQFYRIQFNLDKIEKPHLYKELPSPRRQTDDDLHKFYFSYEKLVESVKSVAGTHVCVEQLYLGSCDLSVDCSLRGTSSWDERFDISSDIKDGILADSINDVVKEFDESRSAISTMTS